MAKVGYSRAIFFAGSRIWWLALLEIVVIAGVSLIPLTAAAIREVLPKQSGIYLSDAFEKAFLGGQLLFYAIGLIATIIWHCNKDLKSFFPLRALFNLYCLGGIVVSSVIIGYDPTLASIDQSVLAKLSVTLFLSASFLYVLMTIISQVHVNVGKSLAEDDADLTEAVRRSRGLR
jgi:hypothetical protein